MTEIVHASEYKHIWDVKNVKKIHGKNNPTLNVSIRKFFFETFFFNFGNGKKLQDA